MNHDRYDDAYIADILKTVKTIAVLGASPNPARPSFGVIGFLLSKGYRVIPVNPGQAGKTIQGQTVYGTLGAVPDAVDMVDVFRAPEFLEEVVDEVLALPARPKVLWTQLGVRDDAAAARAEAAGIKVVQDRCPAIEYPRLLGH
ncbi:CoA-binding protein [Rhizobium sp. SSA_523]|uniref:CoA-binding protein n=1 Tax=Rhizobium sp. SSA_523 TaxID=2952477 RepID=UPI0020919D67|nr:CoA-binding protein [Rhizobium sp. SSA_523]MCO5730668.1 CoA-binding protein [Rhizobium sp. SSA_523]WKC24503.1 CoA-binding protein [Rhizobium sp. SSA_523]